MSQVTSDYRQTLLLSCQVTARLKLKSKVNKENGDHDANGDLYEDCNDLLETFSSPNALGTVTAEKKGISYRREYPTTANPNQDKNDANKRKPAGKSNSHHPGQTPNESEGRHKDIDNVILLSSLTEIENKQKEFKDSLELTQQEVDNLKMENSRLKRIVAEREQGEGKKSMNSKG